jgi:membrane-associated phospholipid phosphatase
MIKLLYHKDYFRSLFAALIIGLLGALANIAAMNYVNTLSYREIPHDLLHEIIPFNDIFSVMAESAIIIMGLIFVIYIIRNKSYKDIPFYIAALGVFYIFRALILPLTPLTNPYPYPGHFGILQKIIPYGGAFPSGHTGFVFMIFFFVDKKHKIMKNIMLFFAIITAFLMIISRGHYTIDIIGSIFIAMTIYYIMAGNRRELFEKDP